MSYKPTMAEIKQLRARSGAGIRDCKNALIESEGEIQGAFDWLRMRGIAKAAKKSNRIAAEGTIFAKIEGTSGVLLEVNCETDFAAGTDDFKAFVQDTADLILSQSINTMEDLAQAEWNNGMKTEEYIKQIVFKIGENVRIRRFSRFESGTGTHLHYYVHGKRLGGFVEVAAPAGEKTEDVLDELCMHIVASRPQCIASSDIPADIINKEQEIEMERAAQDESLASKPENVLRGIISGRIKKWSKSIALLEQEWYEEKMPTAKKLQQFGNDLGGVVQVKRFAMYGLGDGIEKKQDNFAEEVASMSQS